MPVGIWEAIKAAFGLRGEEGRAAERHRERRRRVLVRLAPGGEQEVVVTAPRTDDQAVEAAEQLKMGSIVIVNLQHRPRNPPAQRVVDFLVGVAYGINVSFHKIGEGMFLFAPAHVYVRSDLLEEGVSSFFLPSEEAGRELTPPLDGWPGEGEGTTPTT